MLQSSQRLQILLLILLIIPPATFTVQFGTKHTIGTIVASNASDTILAIVAILTTVTIPTTVALLAIVTIATISATLTIRILVQIGTIGTIAISGAGHPIITIHKPLKIRLFDTTLRRRRAENDHDRNDR